MGELFWMLFKLCGFGQRKPNNIIDSQISQGSDGSNETEQNIQGPDVAPLLINYVCHYSAIFFLSHFVSQYLQLRAFNYRKVRISSTPSLVTFLAYKEPQKFHFLTRITAKYLLALISKISCLATSLVY